jgi:hypothetical protein
MVFLVVTALDPVLPNGCPVGLSLDRDLLNACGANPNSLATIGL